jgi:uncharacterized protein YciI
MKVIKEHLQFQVALEKKRIMFAAGPNWTDDEESWEGDGMVVIRAKSLAEATDIMKRDPMHKSGARKFKIRPWFVNEGTVSVRLNYSQGTFEMIWLGGQARRRVCNGQKADVELGAGRWDGAILSQGSVARWRGHWRRGQQPTLGAFLVSNWLLRGSDKAIVMLSVLQVTLSRY